MSTRELGLALVLGVTLTSQGKPDGLLVVGCTQVALAVGDLGVVATFNCQLERRIAELDGLGDATELVQNDAAHLHCRRTLYGVLGVRAGHGEALQRLVIAAGLHGAVAFGHHGVKRRRVGHGSSIRWVGISKIACGWIVQELTNIIPKIALKVNLFKG